ncbi:hypothetical protein EJB05_54742, partial [Eragrostis curvula]
MVKGGVVALMLAMAAALVVAAAATDDAVLRYPGRPGSRPRSPIFPGFPGARPSPPSSSGARPSPPPGVPSTPVFQPPCPVVGQPARGLIPGFPGLPGSYGGSPSSSPTECVTPLAGLMTCGTFLTGSESETPTPQSECCNGLGAFLNSSSAAGDDDRTLRCLCPVILGDVNRMLPKPIDPVRMMYLPIACGVTLPPQAIYICFSKSSIDQLVSVSDYSGQQAPPLVSRIPEMWEKPTSGKRLCPSTISPLLNRPCHSKTDVVLVLPDLSLAASP